MNKLTSKKKLREFGYLIGVGVPFIFGLILPFITGHNFRLWTLFISIPVLIIGIFSPAKLNNVYKLWMKLGHIMGWLNSKIILGLVFLLVLQPIALIMKLFGYDPLRKRKEGLSSYKEENKSSRVDLNRIF